MIKNVKLKTFLINTIFVILSKINQLIPKKNNRVLLYSNMGFRDNVESLYQFMIEQNYNENYEIICSSNDFKSLQNIKNVKFVGQFVGIMYFFTSTKIYYCFGRIPITPAKSQTTVQMWHGTSFKGFDKSTQITNSISKQFYTWTFSSSEFFIPIVSVKFAVPKKNIFLCGHPRTDVFYKQEYKEEKKYSLIGDYVIWLPTFRKSNVLGYQDSEIDFALPIINDLEELKSLDMYLETINIKLLIKLHPMQDDFEYNNQLFNKIIIYNDDGFRSEDYNLYEILKYSQALITDYSSVFYDYLLLDRPIGFTEDDMSSYSEKRGFAIDDPDKFRPGFKIRNVEDLKEFLLNISDGQDYFKEDRKEINKIVNKYQDGGNCKRALDLTGIKL